jgi:hypothetical protein
VLRRIESVVMHSTTSSRLGRITTASVADIHITAALDHSSVPLQSTRRNTYLYREVHFCSAAPTWSGRS